MIKVVLSGDILEGDGGQTKINPFLVIVTTTGNNLREKGCMVVHRFYGLSPSQREKLCGAVCSGVCLHFCGPGSKESSRNQDPGLTLENLCPVNYFNQ